MAIAVKGERGVDDVLERPRAGNSRILGHLTHQADCDTARLRDAGQDLCDLHHLSDPAGATFDVSRSNCLNRVNDDEGDIGAVMIEVADHDSQVVVVSEQ